MRCKNSTQSAAALRERPLLKVPPVDKDENRSPLRSELPSRQTPSRNKPAQCDLEDSQLLKFATVHTRLRKRNWLQQFVIIIKISKKNSTSIASMSVREALCRIISSVNILARLSPGKAPACHCLSSKHEISVPSAGDKACKE